MWSGRFYKTNETVASRRGVSIASEEALVRLLLLLLTGATLAGSDTAVLEIPPVKSSLNVRGQPVTIISTGTITRASSAWGKDAYRVTVTADLSDLQHHVTELLAAQLNKDDKCGEFLEVQRATLVPTQPSALLTANVRYERTACAKAFGRQIAKKIVSGNGVVEVKLTPVVEANRTVRLAPEVGRIDADGSLGELLRSGTLGDRVREKIEESMVNSIQKAANLVGTLPASIQQRVSIQQARFADAGSGRIAVVVTGDVRMTAQQEKSVEAALAGRD
jgi:hypothetical protein